MLMPVRIDATVLMAKPNTCGKYTRSIPVTESCILQVFPQTVLTISLGGTYNYCYAKVPDEETQAQRSHTGSQNLWPSPSGPKPPRLLRPSPASARQATITDVVSAQENSAFTSPGRDMAAFLKHQRGAPWMGDPDGKMSPATRSLWPWQFLGRKGLSVGISLSLVRVSAHWGPSHPGWEPQRLQPPGAYEVERGYHVSCTSVFLSMKRIQYSPVSCLKGE